MVSRGPKVGREKEFLNQQDFFKKHFLLKLRIFHYKICFIIIFHILDSGRVNTISCA